MDGMRKKLLPWLKAQCGYFSVEQPISKEYKILVLPRNSYFESYKTYPLSVGRDIQKIAAAEGRQFSPYNKSENAFVQYFVIKQSDRYLVYYFILHPKFSEALDNLTPWLIIPESLLSLLKVNSLVKDGVDGDQFGCTQSEDGIWFSKVANSDSESHFDKFTELLELLKPQWLNQTILRLYNPKLVTQASKKFDRWSQLKWLTFSLSAVTVYFLVLTLYQMAINYYLEDKRSVSAPIVSEIFSVKSQVDKFKLETGNYDKAYAETTNNLSAMLFIESLQSKHQLSVDRLRFFDNRVVLEGIVENANSLLAEINEHTSSDKAIVKGDIRKAGSGGKLEKFTIEFYWEDKLWQ